MECKNRSGVKWDIAIFHGESQDVLARNVAQSIKNIEFQNVPDPVVEILGDISMPGKHELDVFDDIIENSQIIMFFRHPDFFDDRLNGYAMSACLDDRIRSEDKSKHDTIWPLDIEKNTRVKGKHMLNGLNGLIVEKNGDLSKRTTEKIRKSWQAVLRTASQHQQQNSAENVVAPPHKPSTFRNRNKADLVDIGVSEPVTKKRGINQDNVVISSVPETYHYHQMQVYHNQSSKSDITEKKLLAMNEPITMKQGINQDSVVISSVPETFHHHQMQAYHNQSSKSDITEKKFLAMNKVDDTNHKTVTGTHKELAEIHSPHRVLQESSLQCHQSSSLQAVHSGQKATQVTDKVKSVAACFPVPQNFDRVFEAPKPEGHDTGEKSDQSDEGYDSRFSEDLQEVEKNLQSVSLTPPSSPQASGSLDLKSPPRPEHVPQIDKNIHTWGHQTLTLENPSISSDLPSNSVLPSFDLTQDRGEMLPQQYQLTTGLCPNREELQWQQQCPPDLEQEQHVCEQFNCCGLAN